MDLSTETGHGSASKGLAMLVLGVKRDTHRHTIHIHSHHEKNQQKLPLEYASTIINFNQKETGKHRLSNPFHRFRDMYFFMGLNTLRVITSPTMLPAKSTGKNGAMAVLRTSGTAPGVENVGKANMPPNE